MEFLVQSFLRVNWLLILIFINVLLTSQKHSKAEAFKKFHKNYDIDFTPEIFVAEEKDRKTVLVIGAGPAGLASAIALKKANSFENVIVLEKRDKYTREQICNFTKHAILSMIDLEPRILIHLLEIGRAFFFDEHILLDRDPSIKPISIDMRPFQNTVAKILGQAIPDRIGKISKIKNSIPALSNINSDLLKSEKSAAETDRFQVDEIVFATPINDVEHALNFVARHYYGIKILNYEADLQNLGSQFKADLFVDASGGIAIDNVSPCKEKIRRYKYQNLNLEIPILPTYSYIGSEDKCNVFPFMFYGKNFHELCKDRENTSEFQRYDKWESVYHTFDSLDPQIARCTITVKISDHESYTFIVMPEHQLTFELRPSSEAFLRRIGLEFALTEHPYRASTYLEAKNILEAKLQTFTTPTGTIRYFNEYFSDTRDHSTFKNQSSSPMITVGDRAFQGLAYLGLGAGNCFSIYANILSKELLYPYPENYSKAVDKEIEKNFEKSKWTFAYMNETDEEKGGIPTIKLHDLLCYATNEQEIASSIKFLNWLEETKLQYFRGWLELQKPSEMELKEYLESLLRDQLEELNKSNRLLSDELKHYSASELLIGSFDDGGVNTNSIKLVPLQLPKSQKTQVIHMQQFHHSIEFEWGARIIGQQHKQWEEYLQNFIEQDRSLVSHPRPGSVACAFKKFSSALKHLDPRDEDCTMKTKFIRRFLILEDHLQEAAIDLINYLEYGARFDLIVESQRTILWQLYELQKNMESLVIIDEALLDYPNYNSVFSNFWAEWNIGGGFEVNFPYGEFYNQPQDIQEILHNNGYSPLHQFDSRYSERGLRMIRKAFSNWTPGKETIQQSQMLFRFGAGVVLYALTNIKIFPANSFDTVDKISFSLGKKDIAPSNIYRKRELDTASRVKELAKQGYEQIILLYGEAHDFKQYFDNDNSDFDFHEVTRESRV